MKGKESSENKETRDRKESPGYCNTMCFNKIQKKEIILFLLISLKIYDELMNQFASIIGLKAILE